MAARVTVRSVVIEIPDEAGTGASDAPTSRVAKEATAMTQFQQTASAPSILPTDRAFPAQLAAIAAGVVVALMAVSVASYVADRSAETTIQTDATAVTDGWQAAVTAANRQREMDAANLHTDGWAAALAPQRTNTSTDAAGDGYIDRLLLEDAPVDGFTLRFPMQGAGAAADSQNQRFIHAD